MVVALCARQAGAVPMDTETLLATLRAEPVPVFRTGHTLLPLTTWGPEFPFEVRKEMTEKWGYALQFGRIRPPLVERLADPDSAESRVCALTAADPRKYPLHVTVGPAFSVRTFIDRLPAATWCRDENCELPEGKRVWSPVAPDATFRMIADFELDMLRKVLARAPITILTNGGEYSLGVLGHHRKHWERDPKVMAAKGETDWFEFISARKAHQESIVTEAIRKLVPDRRLYIYYHTSGCPHRGRYGHWWHWAWDYKHMRRVSDMSNSSIYWRHYNSGFAGNNDCLTQALNAAGQRLALDEPLSYNWMNAGWPAKGRSEPPMAEPARYMGYLKCCYTTGMIGGVAGYFAYDDPVNWLWQHMALGRVQALFSHLEAFVRESDLLPGPRTHVWSKQRPAYEFPTGEATLRVLARRHRQKARWLLTAWAAGGDARDATVTVPELGAVTLRARPSGSVYMTRGEADGRHVPVLVDADGMRPTQTWEGRGSAPAPRRGE